MKHTGTINNTPTNAADKNENNQCRQKISDNKNNKQRNTKPGWYCFGYFFWHGIQWIPRIWRIDLLDATKKITSQDIRCEDCIVITRTSTNHGNYYYYPLPQTTIKNSKTAFSTYMAHWEIIHSSFQSINNHSIPLWIQFWICEHIFQEFIIFFLVLPLPTNQALYLGFNKNKTNNRDRNDNIV